ncbi:PKD domain-containing protein [Anditalea andensis]|uniref:PKD domain-containing protein n=1 Tax=Anditalea andensis TaxID=1048983 RepID=A0A074LN01_9BACT|nr:PKD domain-containing protein [Anditalea andensis]KEO75277.1 hypothetical protein EL17_01685 [Anditalea andensis]
MKSVRSFFTSAFFITLFFLSLHSIGQVTTVGKEFWVGFMENHPQGQSYDMAIIVISANEATTGTIDLSGIQPGRVENFTLAAGQNYTLRLPSTQTDFLHRTSGVIENKGIFIQSEGNISIYAFNERARSADGTVVLPLQSLGKDYWITSHFEVLPNIQDYNQNYHNLNADNESLMLVVGVEDNTLVQITPSVQTVDNKSAGVPFTITLNAGQSYQLKARGDLTGSRVSVIGAEASECKNIAVFGGNKWTGIGECGFANDHLFQQMYPTNTWGSEFIHIPLAIRTSGELVKVLAAENGTQVTIDGVPMDVLNAGQYKTYDFNSNGLKEIKSSKPTSVTVFAKSQECNNMNLGNYNQGDPFMILYSPNEQMLQNVTFQAMNVVAIDNNFVSILVKTASKDNTVLDGNNIGNQFKVVPVNPTYAYAIINISGGSHVLSNTDGFIGYVYGFGYLESYGYSVGASLNNLNFETKSEYEFDVSGSQVACLNQEGTWSIIPENEDFQFFMWDFGDGSAVKEGKDITHTYTELGKHTIKVIAAISEESCDSQEDITFEIEVFESEFKIEGINKVCPMVEEHWYQAEEIINVNSIEWTVEGGEIIEYEPYRVLVRWGEANEEAKLIGAAIGQNGCVGLPVEFLVRINLVIEPELPVGPDQICFDPDIGHAYQVDIPVANRAYEWFVEGGEVIGSNEEYVVQVSWDQPGITGKVWYREYSENDALCEGFSEVLEVEVYEAIQLTLLEKTDVKCNGGDSGEIILMATGGNGMLSLEWSHDKNILSPQAGNLIAGVYVIKAKDGLGCEAQLEVKINEPLLLEAALIRKEMTSCFGREDGQATVLLSGGSPPYKSANGNILVNDDMLTLTDLPMGMQSIAFLDALGCEVSISFEIEAPLPLDAEVRVLKPACPGEADGELMVLPTGGKAPYLYTWDYLQMEGDELIGVPGGEYTATIVDASGCLSFGTGMINEEAPKVRMPTGFRPGDGGVNSLYESVSNCLIDYQLVVYNRWGELIYNGSKGWDGTVNGVEVLPDVYTYVIKYHYFMDGQTWVKELRGIFTLLR